MEELIQMLRQLEPMSKELIVHLRSIIRPIEFRKGEIILAEGQICNNILYIESGLVYSYYMVDQKQVSNWFMKEQDVFISVLSFHRRTPSVDTHVALKPCKCWGITHMELEQTFRLFPEFERHGRLLEAEYYCRSEERQIFIKRQTPARKYEILTKEFDFLLGIATNKQLASFLDVSERTFNDMRRDDQRAQRRRSRRA